MHSRFSHWAMALVAPVAIVATVACEDKGKQSQQKAEQLAKDLVPLIERDVAQVRDGLAPGAKKLAENLAEAPNADSKALQDAITKTRRDVEGLEFAKSTFFAIVAEDGEIRRSEADTDLLAGQKLFEHVPEMKKALEEGAGVVEVTKEVEILRGVKKGQDIAWVLAHRFEQDGKPGLFVTGWSYRSHAYSLEQAGKSALRDKADEAGEKNAPLSYVFLLKDGKAYGAPDTPDVSQDAIEGLGIPEKAGGGSTSGTVEITKRTFGYAAEPAPALGENTYVVALASVF